MRKYILFVVALALLAVLVIGAKYKSKPVSTTGQATKSELPDSSVPVSQYVLGGKVTAISGNEIIVSVSRVMVGPDGNFVDTQTKSVSVGKETQLFIGKLVNKKYTKTAAHVSDISIGDTVTMYSSENIARMESFTPARIDISR